MYPILYTKKWPIMKIDFNTYDLTYSIIHEGDSYRVEYRWLSNGRYKVLKRDSRGDFLPYTGPKVAELVASAVSFRV